MNKNLTCLAVAGTFAAGLGGCAATGLSNDALEITKAEAAATVAHLNATEPEFAGFVGSSAGWAVMPGMMYFHSYLLGGGGGDGLVYSSGSSDPVGYSRNARISVGIGSFGQYNDHVVFFPDAGSMDKFKQGGWEIGGEAAAAIFGLGASGEMSFGGYNVVADPRFGGGAYVAFTFDNYSYNDLSAAMGN